MANRPVSAMSRHETDLINSSRRALASGRVEDSVEKLRHLCLARGAGGILGLGRCFRRIDDNGDKQLNLEEFTKGLHDTGLDVDGSEAQEIFNQFDADGSGAINMTEFLLGIRVRPAVMVCVVPAANKKSFLFAQPYMSESRKRIVDLAFKKLDKTGDGIVTQDDLK